MVYGLFRNWIRRFVAHIADHIADQNVDVIVSTVNPHRDVREEFKKSRYDVRETYVFTSKIRGREGFHVKDFEEPQEKFLSVCTDNLTEEETFWNFYRLI